MKILLKHVNVLDGTLDMKLVEDVDMLLEGETIVKIEKNIVDKVDKTYDLKGKYVCPGLINLHVHLPASGKITKKQAADQKKLVSFIQKTKLTRKVGISLCASYARNDLYSGVTTLRAVGGISNFDSTLSKMILEGKKVGPRIIAADTAVGVPGGHMDQTVAKAARTVDEAVSLVESAAKNGAKLIKLMITGGILDCKEIGHPGDLKMPPEYVKACCDKAHELGLKVAAHVESSEGISVAIKNGVDTIEHGSFIDDELCEELKEHNGALVCTLSPAVPLAKLSYEEYYGNVAMQENSKVLLNGFIDCANKCLSHGVTVGLGTDTGCPLITHYDMWRELVYFNKFIDGVTPSFSLHTATEVNAHILGLDDKIGTLKVGKCADILVLDENPLDDLTTLRKPHLVISRGKVIKGKVKHFDEVDQKLDALLNTL